MIKQGKAFNALKRDIESRMSRGEENIPLHELINLMGEISYTEFTKGYDGKEVALALSNFVNSMHHDSRDSFIDTLLSDHRQLQSNTWNLFYKCLEGWSNAYDENNYDPRNAGACEMSYVMVRAVENY